MSLKPGSYYILMDDGEIKGPVTVVYSIDRTEGREIFDVVNKKIYKWYKKNWRPEGYNGYKPSAKAKAWLALLS